MSNATKAQKWGRLYSIPENSVMIDIETSGDDPQKHVCIQIGACAFNDRFEITREFRASLTAPPNRVDKPETLEWWAKTDPELYSQLRSEERPFMDVLEELRVFLNHDGTRPILWGWPASFDLMFLFQYGREYYRRLLYPVHPSRFVDCRSWCMGARGDLITSERQEQIFNEPHGIVGKVHDGLFDSRVQVWCLKRLVEEVRKADDDRNALFSNSQL